MLKRNFGTSSLQVSALGYAAGHVGYGGGHVRYGGVTDHERERWENAFAPHARAWGGEL